MNLLPPRACTRATRSVAASMCAGWATGRDWHACASIKPDTRNMRVRYCTPISGPIINFCGRWKGRVAEQGMGWNIGRYYMIMRRG